VAAGPRDCPVTQTTARGRHAPCSSCVPMLQIMPRYRALLPRFLFGRSVLAWRCSGCGKMFALSVEEAQRLSSMQPPQHIQAAFGAHDCEIELDVLAERAQHQSTSYH
jgi:hypothetical protein